MVDRGRLGDRGGNWIAREHQDTDVSILSRDVPAFVEPARQLWRVQTPHRHGSSTFR